MAENEVIANAQKLLAEFDDRVGSAVSKACAIVRNDAIKNAPHKTGELQRSIEFEVSDDGSEGIIYSNLEYAPYVEVGTGIYATKGQGRDKPWYYPVYDSGDIKFIKTVGMRARPYLEPALSQNTTKIKECFEEII